MSNAKTLELSLEHAREMYKTASAEIRKLLEVNFNKSSLLPDVIERINGWSDMLAETGRPDIPEFNELPEDLRSYFKSVYKNIVMVEAYNEGERINIYDKSKTRHYPCFVTNGSPSFFAFNALSFGLAVADAGSGSRLSLKSEKLARHIGEKHTDIIREMLES